MFTIWGKACQFELKNGLDFKNKNVLYAIDELGIKISNRLRILSNNVNTITDEIDNLVQELAQIDYRTAEIITWHYVKTLSEPIRNKAQLFKLPKSTYFDLLQKGRLWIAAKLIEIY